MSNLATTDATLARAEQPEPFVECLGVPLAMLPDLPIDTIERLRAIAKEEKREIAQQACAAAIVAFQAECPVIEHTRAVTDRNNRELYTYAPYEQVMKQIKPLLAKYQLSPSFDQIVENGIPVVTCTITHTPTGGTRTAKFACPVDKPNAATNEAKQMASANSFGKRQALIMALNLITVKEDDDASGTSAPVERITAQQADQLRETLASIEELESGATKRVLDWLKEEFAADELEQVPAKSFGMVERAFQKKLKSLEGEKS